MNTWLDWLNLGTTVVVGTLVGKYLPSYLSKKAENLATREDIAAITEEVERVRHDYSGKLESVKAELGSRLHTHSVRYSNEYAILSLLSPCLVDLRDSATTLRPQLDHTNPNESGDERRQRRLRRLDETRAALYEVSEKKQPFYPPDIYTALSELNRLCTFEGIDYAHKDPHKDHRAYWDEAASSASNIVQKSTEALQMIRERVEHWERIGNAEGAAY